MPDLHHKPQLQTSHADFRLCNPWDWHHDSDVNEVRGLLYFGQESPPPDWFGRLWIFWYLCHGFYRRYLKPEVKMAVILVVALTCVLSISSVEKAKRPWSPREPDCPGFTWMSSSTLDSEENQWTLGPGLLIAKPSQVKEAKHRISFELAFTNWNGCFPQPTKICKIRRMSNSLTASLLHTEIGNWAK